VEALDIAGRFQPLGSGFSWPGRWWGSTVRGALGAALRSLVCTAPRRRCETCRHAEGCSFPEYWQPTRESSAGPLYRLPPWLLRVAWRADELLVTLRLFGPAMEDQARFRIALESALARGLTPARRPFLPSAPMTVALVRGWSPAEGATRHPLVVHFRSPLRLIRDGSPQHGAPDFAALLRAAARRWRLAALSWGWPPPPPRPPEVRVEAFRSEVRWEDHTRRSARQQATLTLGGLVGWASYEGEWAVAVDYLRVASLLGLGKLTTHGFGQVEFGVEHPAPEAGG